MLIAFAATIGTNTSWALNASDTMAAWQAAPAAQKRKLVSKILEREAPESVIECVDAASDVRGHADLPIAEVVQTCVASESEPV